MNDEILAALKSNVDDDFFKCIEQCLGFIVPKAIRNILKFNYYNSAFTMGEIDEKAISEIEDVMRSDFDIGMVPENEIPDYLCRYANNQVNFKLIGGQRKLILAMAHYCSKITNQTTVIQLPPAIRDHRNQNSASQTENVNQNNRSSVDTSAICVNRADIQDVFKQLNKWMLTKSALSKILTGNLVLKVAMSSLQVHPDSSISCLVHCPVEGCTCSYTVTRKAYPTYYGLKKNPNKIQKLAAPKWYLSGMQNHLLNEHANDDQPQTDDVPDDHASIPTGANQSQNTNDYQPQTGDVPDDHASIPTGANQSQNTNDYQPQTDDVPDDHASIPTGANQSQNSNDYQPQTDDVPDDHASMPTSANQSQNANDDQPQTHDVPYHHASMATATNQSEPPTRDVLDGNVSITAVRSQAENANYTKPTYPTQDEILLTFDRTVNNKQIYSQKRNMRKRPSTSQSVTQSKRPKEIPFKYR